MEMIISRKNVVWETTVHLKLKTILKLDSQAWIFGQLL